MCGHYAVDYLKLAQSLEAFYLEEPLEEDALFAFRSTDDFFPSKGASHTMAPVIFNEDGKRKLSFFRWDLVPPWWKGPLSEKKFATFNARSESLGETASFKHAWSGRQRCLVPATAFYEWPDKKTAAPGAKRTRHCVTLSDASLFAMAGIWDTHRDANSENELRSFAIVTTVANAALAQIPHPRMPVILNRTDADVWLDANVSPETALNLLRSYPAENMVVEKK